MRKVFVSHPFASDPNQNKKNVDEICKWIIENGENVLPVSPIHLFSFVEDEKGIRDDIIAMCFDLIDICDEVWLIDMNDDSVGMAIEKNYAKLGNKIVRYYTYNGELVESK